jgi:hypothetical protein
MAAILEGISDDFTALKFNEWRRCHLILICLDLWGSTWYSVDVWWFKHKGKMCCVCYMCLCELPAVHNMKLPLQVFHFLALIGASISFCQGFCSCLTCVLFLRFTELGQLILTLGFKLILVDLLHQCQYLVMMMMIIILEVF